VIANARFDIGWETLIAIVVIVLALTLLGIVALTRELREHHLRLGFFIERGDELSEPYEEERHEPGPDARAGH